MRQVFNLLSPLEVKASKEPGYFHDGGGLFLQVSAGGGRSWILRYSMAGRRREMGLGPYPAVSLAAARKSAAESRSLVKARQDPIAARDAERARQRLEEARGITFDKAVELFLAGNEVGWKNQKHRLEWRTSLRVYASPLIGTLPVGSIDTSHVTKVLDPIWHEKTETASRIRGRIERVLDWARVRGYRAAGENPARWRGHLEETYPARGKVRPVEHHAAVTIDAMPMLYGRLAEADDVASLALRFIILTAARAGEAVGATWSEVDLDEGVWTIPGSRMKAGRIHRVPLSHEATTILQTLSKLRTGAHVFPGLRSSSRALSVRAILRGLREAGETKATVHGFRSTFRDWAAERTNVPRDVAEMALAHAIGNRTEAAYRRGELMTKRATLMDQWSRFLLTPSDANVVPIGRQRASVSSRAMS
jgi:integrase